MPELDDPRQRRAIPQRFCTTCRMPLILQGHYVAEKVLGAGGFGAAYLARDLNTPSLRQCVIKQLRPNFTDPGDIQKAHELFEREGTVLEKLGEHPQIPYLFAFFDLEIKTNLGQHPDRFFYLVQELVEGDSLEDELIRQGPLSEAQVLQLLQELLPVLQFIHDRRSIHRDIKPSNIMRQKVANVPGQSRLYLIDFGAVKQFSGTQLTQKGHHTSIYTPYFAPPEQIRGDRVSPSSDLYALAVTCLVLLTGKGPETLFDAYRGRWNWSATVSSNLQNVLEKMLKPLPGDRYGSANEVLAALSFSENKSKASTNQVVLRLEERASLEEREKLASDPNTPIFVLEQLANDTHRIVRRKVAENPNTSSSILEYLAQDQESFSVRRAVAKNLNTPIAVLINLAKDKQLDVVKAAYDNPQFPESEHQELAPVPSKPFHPGRMRSVSEKLKQQQDDFEREYKEAIKNIEKEKKAKLSNFSKKQIEGSTIGAKFIVFISGSMQCLLGYYAIQLGGLMVVFACLWITFWGLVTLMMISLPTVSEKTYSKIWKIKNDAEEHKKNTKKEFEKKQDQFKQKMRESINHFKRIPANTLTEEYIVTLSDEDQFLLLQAIQEREDRDKFDKNVRVGLKALAATGVLVSLFTGLPFFF
ncbi:serine/threonine protein kinase [Candidatus Synechococcus calcipolaris G9]|uniref:non-specific serine/threonine protein kinase n=1 Tax=Candidatus Synechococcus calcipolaris G9 TaxID=1497997 RepID=A0ABT6EYW5_9SYNE|nr:protein kinase [Candidatus Synechococcus calcipolaris]MDG2990591.1 serine/threonine protein kinase [Candidatus Synechococcus calcipolaris G9]